MAEPWDTKKRTFRMKRSYSLDGLATLDPNTPAHILTSLEPLRDGQLVKKSTQPNQTNTESHSLVRSRSVCLDCQRLPQLKNLVQEHASEEAKGERKYHTQISLHRSCENLQQMLLDDSETRSDPMETGTSVSQGLISPFNIRSRSRSLTPTSPYHVGGRLKPVYVTNASSPVLRPVSISFTKKRPPNYSNDSEDMDLEDTLYPISKKHLVCHSPLHISSSSPCTSPICSSPHRKSFVSCQRPSNSSVECSLHPANSFSSRDGSMSSAPHSMSSDGEFDTESELYGYSIPCNESNKLSRGTLDVESTIERKKVPARLNFKFPEDSNHTRLRRKSSSDSLCDSAVGLSDTQSNTPLSPRELKFLQYPTSSSHLPVPVPRSCTPPSTHSLTPSLQTIIPNADTTMAHPGKQPLMGSMQIGGGDSEFGAIKGLKWKKSQDTGALSKNTSLFTRRHMSSLLVSSAFSNTTGIGTNSLNSKEETDMEDVSYDNSNFFEPREIPNHYSQLLPSNIDGENSLGFNPTPHAN